MSNLIEIKQLPVITHSLKEAGQKVTERINSLELEKQVVTEDTIKSMKDTRAELNKEFLDFETQRKAIKEKVSNPYEEFNILYKVEIEEKYKNADALLKTNIFSFEDKLKKAKKAVLVEYFNELCVCENIDFLVFENTMIDPNLSTSEKKYKEQVLAFIEKTIDDLNLIKTQEFEAEILVEYKKNRNVSLSISGVIQRKEAEKEEQRRLILARSQKRQMKCVSIMMIWHDITRSYAFNDDLFFTQKEIETLEDEEFEKKFIEISAEITKINNSNIVSAPVEVKAAKPAANNAAIEKTLVASFEVTGTLSQLQALAEYLKTNNLTYKNI